MLSERNTCTQDLLSENGTARERLGEICDMRRYSDDRFLMDNKCRLDMGAYWKKVCITATDG
jgi:hypothetical protein